MIGAADPMDERRTSPHWTYVARSAEGAVLYVGCTRSPLARLRTHRSKADWFVLATQVDWRQWPNFEAGRAAEAELIRALRPRHNRHHMTSGRSIFLETLAS